MKIKRKKLAIVLAVILCVIIIYICTVIGSASISFEDAKRILLL